MQPSRARLGAAADDAPAVSVITLTMRVAPKAPHFPLLPPNAGFRLGRIRLKAEAKGGERGDVLRLRVPPPAPARAHGGDPRGVPARAAAPRVTHLGRDEALRPVGVVAQAMGRAQARTGLPCLSRSTRRAARFAWARGSVPTRSNARAGARRAGAPAVPRGTPPRARPGAWAVGQAATTSRPAPRAPVQHAPMQPPAARASGR